MKQFVYLFFILLASTASFAMQQEPENPKNLKRAFSTSALRFTKEEKQEKLPLSSSRERITRPRSGTQIDLENPDLIIEEPTGASAQKPESEDELPSVEDLMDCRKLKLGEEDSEHVLVFNLGAIEKRQMMVRKDQEKFGAINQEPAVHLVNLGISTFLFPNIMNLSEEVQDEIENLAAEKGDLKSFIAGLKKRLKETKEEKTRISLEQQIESSQITIQKIDKTLGAKLKKYVSATHDCETAVVYIQSIVKVKRRIIEDFEKHGITIPMKLLRCVPPRNPHHEWKMRAFSEMPRFTLDMAPEERGKHFEALREFYNPSSLNTGEDLGGKAEPEVKEESEEEREE